MVRPNLIVVLLLLLICVLVLYPPKQWLSSSGKISSSSSSPPPHAGIDTTATTNVVVGETGAAAVLNAETTLDVRGSSDEPSLSSPTGGEAGGRFDELAPPLRNIHLGKSYTPKVHEYGWVFKEYIPSKLETEFYEAVGPIETTDWVLPMAEKFKREFQQLVDEMKSRVAPNEAMSDFRKYHEECKTYVDDVYHGRNVSSSSTCLSSTHPMDPDIFSRFEYEFQCIDEPCRRPPPPHPAPVVGARHTSFIEPLVGLLRHPLVFMRNSLRPTKTHKGYMIMDKWALNNLHLRYRQKEKHSHYFDCGASTYTDGAGGASQNWFIGLGDCMCTPFNTMRLWEMEQHAPKRFWRGVPERLHPNYMWYNYPLSADPDSFSNPLNHLVSKVKFGDPVIMKIDFDTPVLELKLIQQIQQTPDVYRRIDEFFFEHHVQIPLMAPIWGQVDKKCFIRCSIDVFVSLRKLGIRAHSWV